MSTRSCISALCEDGKIRATYCHYDGYPEYVGRTLKDNYCEQEKIEKLLALGSLSSLGASIDCPEGHSYNNQTEGYTVAYHRDRGEDFEPNEEFEFESSDPLEVLNGIRSSGNFTYVDYLYYWDGTHWSCMKNWHGECVFGF